MRDYSVIRACWPAVASAGRRGWRRHAGRGGVLEHGAGQLDVLGDERGGVSTTPPRPGRPGGRPLHRVDRRCRCVHRRGHDRRPRGGRLRPARAPRLPGRRRRTGRQPADRRRSLAVPTRRHRAATAPGSSCGRRPMRPRSAARWSSSGSTSAVVSTPIPSGSASTRRSCAPATRGSACRPRRIGVEGGPVLVSVQGVPGADQAGKGLKEIDPARYGSLEHPGDGVLVRHLHAGRTRAAHRRAASAGCSRSG